MGNERRYIRDSQQTKEVEWERVKTKTMEGNIMEDSHQGVRRK